MAIKSIEALLTVKTKGDTSGLKATKDELNKLSTEQKKLGTETQKTTAQIEREERELKEMASEARKAEQAFKGLGRQDLGTLLASSRNVTSVMSNLKSAIVGGIAGAFASTIGMNLSDGFNTAVEGALKFQENITKVGLFTSVTDETINKFKGSLDRLKSSTLQTSTELSEGFYVLASAGQTGAEGIDLLEQAGKGATMGMGTLPELLMASSAALENFGDQGLTAAMALSQIKIAADVGNFDPKDLASNLGAVLPAAKAAGAGFDEVTGSIARLTVMGFSAAEASQRTEALFRQMQQSSPQATKALDAVGLSFNKLKQNISDDGLLSALQDLDKRLKDRFGADAGMALRDIFQDSGAVTAFQGLVADAEKSMETFGATANATGNELQETFEEFQKSDYGKLITAQKALAAEFSKLATAVLPLLTQALTFMVENFDTLKAAAIALAAMLGVGGIAAAILAVIPLLGSFGALVTALTTGQWLWNAALTANPIGAIIVLVAAFVGVLVYLYIRFEAVREACAILVEVLRFLFDVVRLVVDIFLDLAAVLAGDLGFERTQKGVQRLTGDFDRGAASARNFWGAVQGPKGQLGETVGGLPTYPGVAALVSGANAPGGTPKPKDKPPGAFDGDGSGSYGAFRDGAKGGAGGAAGKSGPSFAKTIADLEAAIKLASYTSEEAHQLETRMEQELSKFRQANITLTEAQIAQIREKITLLKQTEDISKFEAGQAETLKTMGQEMATMNVQLGNTRAERERIAVLAKVDYAAAKAGLTDTQKYIDDYAEIYDQQVEIKRLGALSDKIIDKSDQAMMDQYTLRLQDIDRLLREQIITSKDAVRAARDARREWLSTQETVAAGLELGKMSVQDAASDRAGRTESAYTGEWGKANQDLLDMQARLVALQSLMETDPINSGHYSRQIQQLGFDAANLRVEMGNGSWTDVLLGGLDQFMGSFTNVMTSLRDSWGDFFTSFTDGFANSIGRAVVEGESLRDALGDVARSALSELVSSLVKVGMQWVIMKVLGDSLSASTTALSVAEGGIVAAAWAPAAAMVSLATLGANSAPAMAGISATTALSTALSLFKGFSKGGYTGNGGTQEVAGVVHGQEFVVNADATKKNMGLLQDLNAGRTPRATLTGGVGSDNGGMNLNVFVENNSTASIEVERLSSGDVRIIAREEADRAVAKQAPALVAREMDDPNSRVSKAMGRNTTAGRRRNG